MKRISLILAMVAFATITFAQNLQLHYDFGEDRKMLTSTVEMFKPDAYGSTFFFIDMDYQDTGISGAYWEIARELKFWEGPISAHVEYNGGLTNTMSFNNSYLLGGTYSYNNEDFSKGFSLSASYKYIQKLGDPHNFQLTAVWYMNFFDGKILFSGFADFWKESTVVSNDFFVTDSQDIDFIFITEPQVWYNFNKHFAAGTEIEISNNFGGNAGFMVNPTLGVKYNF